MTTEDIEAAIASVTYAPADTLLHTETEWRAGANISTADRHAAKHVVCMITTHGSPSDVRIITGVGKSDDPEEARRLAYAACVEQLAVPAEEHGNGR